MTTITRLGLKPVSIDLEKQALKERKSTRKSRAAYVETHRRLAKEINKKHWFKKWIL